MTDKQMLMNAYTRMTPWARGIILELALGYAIDFPELKSDLMSLAIESPANNADESVNGFSLISVGQPIDG